MFNPDKFIRKFFVSALSNMVVSGKTIKVYDSHTPNNDDNLIILSTQLGANDWQDKCGVTFNKTIEIQVLTRFKGSAGNRQLLDDIIEEIQQRCQNIQIDNFIVQDWSFSISNDFATSTNTETIFRKIVNYNLIIK